jgi:hypothetical protein
MKAFLKKIVDSNCIFAFIMGIFFLALAVTVTHRGGRDLKVGLFGIEQVLQKSSPYRNPLDSNRTIFRYAPGITILEYPFLLKSKPIAPYEFTNILPSIIAWYLFEIIALAISGLLLLKLIPAVTPQIQMRNLKLSFLMALPLIGYELSNSQNKIPALLFMLIAIFLFEKKRPFLSAVSFCLAITIYVPLASFLLYFLLRTKGRFIVHFIAGAFVVFLLIPSLVFGPGFNVYLLKEWFNLALKPFIFTNSYATYIDLRHSNQSLPGAIGRMFVSGNTEHFYYFISPETIHIIIKLVSLIIVIFSCIAVWRREKAGSRGLEYSIFLVPALILPSYCIYYTWAWLFVPYFAVFNYIGYPETPLAQKRILLGTTLIAFISSCFIGINPASDLSFIFWGTVILWLGLVITLRSEQPGG